MTDESLLDSDGRAVPLPADPLSPVPDEVERDLAAYRAGDAAQAPGVLTAIADTGRTSVSWRPPGTGSSGPSRPASARTPETSPASCSATSSAKATSPPQPGATRLHTRMCDGTLAGYAAHRQGHVLFRQDEKERASKVLQ